MSIEILHQVMLWMIKTMNVSILIPMAVVWRRKQQFAAPIKLLSWYVYLSAISAAGAWFLYPAYLPNNYGFLIGFNLGKVALLGAVYYQVLAARRVRGLVLVTSVATVIGSISLWWVEHSLAVTVSRVAQCAVLAAFALAYLDQELNREAKHATRRDPLWLLSVGQLLYSAGTVTAFSLDYLSVTANDQTSKYMIVALAGLVFNGFLTLAFLRAQPDFSAAPGFVAASPVATF